VEVLLSDVIKVLVLIPIRSVVTSANCISPFCLLLYLLMFQVQCAVIFTGKEPCLLYRVFLYKFETFCCIRLSASDWLLVQRSPTECGVSTCDREAP